MKRIKSSPTLTVISLCLIVAVSAIVLAASTRSSRAANFYSTVRSWVGEAQKDAPLVGEVTLTATGGTATGTFTTLKGAFDAINAGTHQGVIAISINADTSEGATTATLNASGIGSASYTSISIKPAGGAARTISGATTAGSPLIDFSGADNVTIDGLNTGGNSLTISNTTASPTSITSTIRFIGGATNNTITNSSILGSFSAAVGTNGGNIFFSTDAVTPSGNDNNTISNNNIGPAGANLPTKGVYFNGSTSTTAINNSGNVITGNNIFDYFGAAVSSAGVYSAGGNTDNTVSNNRFYQTATRTQTTGAQHSAIWITNTSGNNFQVTGNTIGFASNAGTGTYNFVAVSSSSVLIPIFLNVGSTTATSVQGNTIAGIAMSGAGSGTSSSASFRGIYVSDGLTNIGNVTGNTIGSMSATGSITYTSSSASTSNVIGMYNFGNFNWTVSNNSIGGITASNSSTGASAIYGIRVNTLSTVTFTCQGNTIGGTVANSIQSTTTATGSLVDGILVESPAGTITGNTVRNLTAAGGTGSNASASVAGILINASSANHTVSQNTVHTLVNTSASAATSVIGIYYSSSTGTNLVARNFIHSFSASSTAGLIYGMFANAGTATYQNNMIRLGVDAAGSSITTAVPIIGVNDGAGTNNYYFNSIFIGGTGVGTTASNTFAFSSLVTTNTRVFEDNIFVNARSNATTGGKHYAIKVGGTTSAPTGLTLNYNDYLVTGTGGVFGSYNGSDVTSFTAWKTTPLAAGNGPGLDANSFNSDPQFVNPTGTSAPSKISAPSAVLDLHINPSVTTVVEANGLAIGGITDDFDGQTRASLTPTDIGADAGNFTGVDLTPPVISYTALTNTTSTSNRTLTATITDAGSGVPTSGAGLPVLYWKINAGSYTAATATSLGSNQYQFSFGAGVVAGNTVSYYVVAQDGAATPNVTSNPSAGASGFTASPPAASTPPTTPNSYLIAAAISGTKTVCASGCDYSSLTNAGGVFADINAKVATANINVEITGDLSGETGAVALNQLTEEPPASDYRVTIYPTGSAHAITGASASGLITLNGVDNAIIDGSLAAAGIDRSLTITNTNAGTSSAVIWLQSTAQNNRVQNLNIVGSGNTQTLFGIGSGSSTISITSAGTSNNSNRIQNNNISKTQYGIYSGGLSAGTKNTGNRIKENLINTASPNNVATGGILVNFESGIQITQNNIGNILKHDGTSGTSGTAFGIALGVVPTSTSTFTGSDVIGANVSENKIDAITQLHTTGYSAFGIVVNSVTSGTTLVSNNMIGQIRAASTSPDFSAGIVAGGGAGSTTQIYFNSVSMTGSRNAAAFPSYGLAIGGSNPTVDVRDNILYNTQTATGGGKSYAIGLAYASPYTNLTSDYNDLLTSGAQGNFGQTGGLGTTGTDRTSLSAWQTQTAKDTNSISSDPLFTSTTDLHINTGSNYGAPPPASNAGTTIAGITTDFDVDTRSSTPDIGADEFTVTRTLSGSSTIPAGNYDSVTVNSPDTATLGANVSISGSLTVKNGATLNLGTFIISGAGTFTLEAGGTLGVGSTTGVTTSGATGNIQVTGTRTYTAGANYVYNGGAAQVTGNALSNAPNNLTINNAAGVMSSVTGLTVTGTLRVQAGTFTSASTYNNVQIDNSATLAASSGETINVTGTWLNNGSFTSNSSTVVFNGSSAQAINGSGPTTFAGLTINNSAGVTLGVNTTVSGVLALTSGDLNTGLFTLFMGTGATSTGTGDVVGSVNRGDLNGGASRSFGNPDVRITETAGSVTDITVTLFKGLTPNDFANSVKRIYRISTNTPASLVATMRLRYIDSELNSNSEATLDLWRKDATLGWQDKLQTTRNDDTVGEQNWVELALVTQFSDWVISGPSAPTEVAMMNFKATRYDKQVHLEWQTGYEVSNVGFNVYREKNGNLERITPEPVAGSALIAGLHVEMKAGLAYSWWDEEEIADCGSGIADCENRRYWIEDIDLSGRTTNHGPFGVSEAATGDVPPGLRDQQLLRKHNSSLLSALGRDASLAQSADASTVPVEPTAKVAKLTAARMTIQAGVASQTAVKLSIQRAGWYRVEQSELVAAGLPSGADPMMLQLFADGREMPMLVTNATASSKKTSGSSVIAGGPVIGGGGSGGVKTSAWDGIEFYGIGIDSPSTANHVYWLAAGAQPGLRIGGSDAKGGSAAPSSFAYAVERRDKTIYFPALKNGGAEKWFGPLIFNAQPVDQSVTLQHVASSGGGGNALMTVSLQGFTNTAHTVRVLFNNVEVGTMHFTGLQKASNKFTIPAGNVHDGVNQIQLIGPAGTSDLSLVESVQVNYFHTNTADNNLLRLPVSGQQQVTIDGFTSSAIRVMDVTDANSPVELPVSVGSAAASKQATSSAYSVTVTAPSSGARTLLAFAEDQQKRPAQIAANQPSNYRDPGLHADYIVITRKDLIGSFDPLIALRKSQNLTSMVIDVEDLYDEFGFGNKSPQAIKDFLTYAKTTWTVPPRFVVLAGDATYDPKNYLALGDFDVVPTRFVETAFNEAATDDWFADMNNDGVPDIAIGRLPVRTPAEAAAMVTKLVNYDSSAASNNVLLVADRNSNYDFEAADAQLRALIPASFTVTDIRRGQLGDADARTQLLAALNSGAKVVNYYGHGSTTVWTDAPILSASDAASLTNTGHLSLVVSMTCLNGYFYTPTIESLGESLLKAQGGAIAVWASSGLTDPTAQTVMSRDAISRLLSGSNRTIGEVVALAKAAITNQDVRRTWILLGDPATRLRDEAAPKLK